MSWLGASRRGTTTIRARLRAGAAALVLALAAAASAPAWAQTQPSAPVEAPADGVGEGIFLDALEILDDREAQVLTARGAVEARYQGRTLRADELTYQTATGVVTARGNVQVLNPDGTVQYADAIELDDQLRAGVIIGFAARLEQNVKLAAATAVRRSETVHELNRAIFTPCDICTPEGERKEPTWSIQAERIVQNGDLQVVYYENAVLKVKGVPVFYTPILWHPDPAAERSSGLLIPRVTLSDRRGLSYEQPYLWVISPYQDLVISPQINARVNPFLNLDWRKRFYSGLVEARAGYTYERNFGDADRGTREMFGDYEHRGYILASGDFRASEAWRWGFSAERATDRTLFDRYDIGDVYETRGLFAADTRRLISQVFAVRQNARSYLSAAVIGFQSLRPLEDEGTFPVIAPLVEGRWEPQEDVWGGRLRVLGSAVALIRDEAPPPAPPGTPGVDSRRASLSAEWRRLLTTDGGVRVEPYLLTRGDVYHVDDGANGDGVVGRGHGTLGVDVRYPLVRREGATTVVLEPIALFALSPKARVDDRLPIEDAFAFDFDETSLFRDNRFPGWDAYEGGARVTLGARATFDWAPGRFARFTVGRAFRSEDDAFLNAAGLRDTSSNWIVSAASSPVAGVVAWGRARLDDETGSLRRGEAAVNFNFERARGFARYITDRDNLRIVREPNPVPGGPPVDRLVPLEEFTAGGEVMATRRWGVTFRGTRDFEERLWRRSEVGLLYMDECIRFELVYERDETRVPGRGPSQSVFIRLNLATLGEAGYRNYDDR